MPALVEARGLVKTYATPRGPVAALDGLDLEVEAGEFLAICGRSGSGKSTLLGLIGGLCRPTSGTVHIDGIDLAALGPGALAEFRARRLGFMFQFAGLLPNVRAVDNIALPALLAGMAERDAYDRARELLHQVGLGARWDAHAAELSGGQQRRVALARALINRAALLLADEPTSDLDEDAEQEVMGLLGGLHRAHGTTLILVTHDRALARRADRVIQLRAGKRISVAVTERAADEGMPGPVEAAIPADPAGTFEPEPIGLAPAEPVPLGAGLVRFLVGFVGWSLVFACGLFAIDRAAARLQRRTLDAGIERRKKAEDLALQQLRADINDVVSRPDGSYELSLYLQNFEPDKPLYVLGPKPRAFVQIDQSWEPIPIATAPGMEDGIHAITARQVFPLTFRADFDRFDELIRGYMHIRISSVMVVAAGAEPTADLFERNDDYYIYLKPQKLSDDEVRRRNGWKPGAIVPRWIAMPPH